MSRGNLLTVVVLVLALAGMFFWTLNLEQRLSGGPAATQSPDRSGAYDQRLDDLETSVISLRELTQSNQIDLAQVKKGLARVEETDAAQARLLSGLTGGTVAAAAGAAKADPTLKSAIEAVLKEKEEKDRAERTERMVKGWSRYLLAEIDATDDQKNQFVKVVSAYWDSRGKVYQKFADSGSDTTARDAEMKTLEEDRNQKLQGIFGAGEFTKIEERMKAGRRWGGSRGGGAPRGNRGGR